MKSRFSFVLAAAAVIMAAAPLTGCPELLALVVPTPTPSVSPTPTQQATMPGGNAYAIQDAAAKPGCNGAQ